MAYVDKFGVRRTLRSLLFHYDCCIVVGDSKDQVGVHLPLMHVIVVLFALRIDPYSGSLKWKRTCYCIGSDWRLLVRPPGVPSAYGSLCGKPSSQSELHHCSKHAPAAESLGVAISFVKLLSVSMSSKSGGI